MVPCANMLPHPLGADAARTFDLLAVVLCCFFLSLVRCAPVMFPAPSFATLLLSLTLRLRWCGSEAIILVCQLLATHAHCRRTAEMHACSVATRRWTAQLTQCYQKPVGRK